MGWVADPQQHPPPHSPPIRALESAHLLVYSGGREITIELPGFTRSTFNELMAVLTPLDQPPAAGPVEAARARTRLPASFTVDARKERSFANGVLVGAVIALLAALGAVALAFTPGLLDGDLSALVMIAPFAGVAGIGLLIGAMHRRRILRGIPGRIGVSQQGLRIDDVDAPYPQLTRICLTPAGYPMRRMRSGIATWAGSEKRSGPRRMPRPAPLPADAQSGATISCATSHSVITMEVSIDLPAAWVAPDVASTT